MTLQTDFVHILADGTRVNVKAQAIIEIVDPTIILDCERELEEHEYVEIVDIVSDTLSSKYEQTTNKDLH